MPDASMLFSSSHGPHLARLESGIAFKELLLRSPDR
jgi:hypothetical protein